MSETAPISSVAATQPVKSGGGVQAAIARASERMGVDFGYLLAQAKVESSLDANAKARTSSASGLFQFIESTWLATMHRHGPALGFGQQAAAIAPGPSGPRVTDPLLRGQILALRNDPQAASLMAGALAQDNRAALMPVLGREPDAGELYLAHFMGSGGAGRFLSALQSNPETPAANLFGKAAAANRGIFYTQGGAPRSLQGVMDLLRGKIERAMPDGGRGGPAITGDPAASSGTAAADNSAPATFAQAARRFAAPKFSQRAFAPANVPDLAPAVRLPKISTLLQDSFSVAGGERENPAGDHARRAYARLKAFGL